MGIDGISIYRYFVAMPYFQACTRIFSAKRHAAEKRQLAPTGRYRVEPVSPLSGLKNVVVLLSAG